jgi:hypothetical protein
MQTGQRVIYDPYVCRAMNPCLNVKNVKDMEAISDLVADIVVARLFPWDYC